MKEHVRVAAAQWSPVLFDPAATVEHALEAIRKARQNDVELLVFPETFIAAYPYWRGHVDVKRSTELAALLFESAITVPGPETDLLAEAAREAGVNLIVGVNELDNQFGSLTVYNSQICLDRHGKLVGKRRKLIPTHSERVYWGMGDERDVKVFPLDIGQTGALVCYEHHMPLVRAALLQAGEEIHCAAWPGWWEIDEHLGGKHAATNVAACEIDAAIREYAIESQAFVISASAYLPPERVPEGLRSEMAYNLAVGGSAIVSPSGRYLAGPIFGQEVLVVADLDARERRLAKAYIDTAGHYARPDLFTLHVKGA